MCGEVQDCADSGDLVQRLREAFYYQVLASGHHDPDDEDYDSLNLEQQLMKGERGKKMLERVSRKDLILRILIMMQTVSLDG